MKSLRAAARPLAVFFLLSLVWPGIRSAFCETGGDAFHNPVILIPGTSRSKLADIRGRVAWGKTMNIFRWKSRGYLALPFDAEGKAGLDGLVPAGIIRGFTFIPYLLKMDVYGSFMDEVRRRGYQIGDLDGPRAGDDFFVFDYDWRRDSVENAALLAEKIERLKAFYGNPSLKFDFIAHSSAHGIVYYYALYGGRDVLEDAGPHPDYRGAENIRRLIELAPVRRGTLYAFRVLHSGFTPFPAPFIFQYPPASAFTAPAFFQLLPHRGERLFVSEAGRILDYDLYNPEDWRLHGWSVFSPAGQKELRKVVCGQGPAACAEAMAAENEKRFQYLKINLKRAAAFHRAIDGDRLNLPDSVEAYSLIPEWGETPERAEVKTSGKIRFSRVRQKELCYGPGDGMVLLGSMQSGTGVREYYFRQKHRRIAADRHIQEKIFELLEKKQSARSSGFS